MDKGELTTRIYAAPLILQVEDQAKIGIRHAFGSPFLQIGALKAYADGSLGSGTAYFFEPFSDQPNNRGILSDEMQSLDLMRNRMMMADAAVEQTLQNVYATRVSLGLPGSYRRRAGRLFRRAEVAPAGYRYHRCGGPGARHEPRPTGRSDLL